MKILTISVAAYNMERLIRQNLDSFVASSVRDDIEVLVINDGSSDSTAEIVREYEAKYPGIIKLFNQENAGPGSTVNRGIENATGKYFRMVDADDWVDSGFKQYVELLKEVDADMIVTDYTCVDDKTGETRFCKANGLEAGKLTNFNDVCAKLEFDMHSITWKTEILTQNSIRLFNGFYTDIQYILFPSQYAETVVYCDVNVYMYRVSLSGQSMAAPSMQRNVKMHDAMLFSIVELYNSIKAEKPEVAKYILNKLNMITGTQLGTLLSFKSSKENKRNLFDYMAKLKSQCPDAYDNFKRLKTVRMLMFCDGLLYPIINRLHRNRLDLND